MVVCNALHRGLPLQVERRFGPELSVTLYGGSKAPVRFRNEAEFYAAMFTNATFDMWMDNLKTAVLNLQDKLSGPAAAGWLNGLLDVKMSPEMQQQLERLLR